MDADQDGSDDQVRHYTLLTASSTVYSSQLYCARLLKDLSSTGTESLLSNQARE